MASLKGDVVDGTEAFPQEIHDDLEEMQIFVTRLMKMRCYRCDRLLPQDFSTEKWFRSWDDRQKRNKKPSICASKCQCEAWTCIGCGKKPASGKYFADIRGYYVDWCCAKGRVFAIWMLLCRYDAFDLKMLPQGQPSNIFASDSQAVQPKRKTGIGYNSVRDNGYTSYDIKVINEGILNFTATDAMMDRVTKNFLAMITRLLPLYAQERAPPGLASMIELSLFQERAAQLLRNDSIKDAQTHGSLYCYLLDFVEKIGTHKDTKFLVTDSRYVKKKSPGLERLSFDGSSAMTTLHGKSRMVQLLEVDRAQKSMSSSLLDSMKNLVIQSDALLRTVHGVSSSFSDASGQEKLALANHVSGLYKTLRKGSGKDKAQPKPTTVSAMWEAYCSEHRVTYVGHDQILRNLSNAKECRIKQHH